MVRVVQTPWLLEVASIVKHPGQQLDVAATMPAPSGIGDEFVGVTEGTPLRVAGTVDALLDGLITSLQITARVHAQCSRCLEDLSGEQIFNLTAFFPYTFTVSADSSSTSSKSSSLTSASDSLREISSSRTATKRNSPYHDRGKDDTHSRTRGHGQDQEDSQEDELGDVYPLLANGVAIDLEAPLRDMFIDQLDEQPLCNLTCEGLCSTCGERLADLPDHQHEAFDQRFDALRNWKSS